MQGAFGEQKQNNYSCEYGCGYKGTFDSVTAHERTCIYGGGPNNIRNADSGAAQSQSLIDEHRFAAEMTKHSGQLDDDLLQMAADLGLSVRGGRQLPTVRGDNAQTPELPR